MSTFNQLDFTFHMGKREADKDKTTKFYRFWSKEYVSNLMENCGGFCELVVSSPNAVQPHLGPSAEG